MKRFDVLISQCEADIRAGQPRAAARRLHGLNLARVPTEWRLPLAKISRRAGLFSFGLALLGKRVHGDGRLTQAPPTAAEIAEYGVLLLRGGAISEAKSYLQRANSSEAPEVLLYQAFADFIVWDFESAIPRLNQYLQSDLSDYARLVAKTNLGYALAETRKHTQAREVLSEVIETARREGHSILERNSLCYRALTYFQEEDFRRAREDVNLAQNQMPGKPTNDELVTLKYRLIFDAVEQSKLEPLNQLRDLALKARDSASHREADLYSLKVEFNLERFLYLYFGTPFQAFRDRLSGELNLYPGRDTYVLGKKSAPRFDLSTGHLDGQPVLNPGHKSHQILNIFLRDFYQPLRINALFSELFPGEHFTASSSDRVHQLLRRTRRWLEQSQFPLAILEHEEFYSLEIVGNFSFRIPLKREVIDPQAVQFRAVREQFHSMESFSAREVREKLDWPKTSTFRLLNWAVQHGHLSQIATPNNQFVYHWNKTSQVKPAA